METLSGQAGAVFALLFAAFTFVPLVFIFTSMGSKWPRDVPYIVFVGVVALAELGTMIAVIDNTWRRTTLRVTRDHVALKFWSLLQPTKRYHWPGERFRSASVVAMTLTPRLPPMETLELLLWDAPLVRLFTGHPYYELADLARMINRLHPQAAS